jgi:adenylate cyclase class IV
VDRHSEVEIKFQADDVALTSYHRLVRDMDIRSFKVIEGTDTFFTFPDKDGFLRHRRGQGWRGLTFKRRKSEDSIVDRVEIDVEIGDSVTDKDVEALVKAMGGTKQFSIKKISHIYRVASEIGKVEHEATLALYDVFVNGKVDQRFLEVEIERDNDCDPEEARVALDKWRKLINNELKVVGPINKSLYEIYLERTKGT